MNDRPHADAALAATDIAIVGMAAHVPGAGDLAGFWANLRAGAESIRRLTEEELLAAGESRARLRQPNYVPFAASLDGFKDFDAEFFGFSPKEAAILDPQHRHFLEVAWEALENAGHPPEHFSGKIGVYAGCGMGSYFYFNLCSNRQLVDETGMFLLRHTGNDKDFLSTRVSHVLDLHGPSINVQTACSTSLVAVHLAAKSLLSGECDMALAGGVTIELPQGQGYLYRENEILSPDGHCHAFDHRAQGTVFGSGAGCVVLRRAADAIRDGDHIWAILKGSAVNNDGSDKAGYLAPSVEGQAACVAEAFAQAKTDPAAISYVECHGTGTYLGDPIEVAALTQAFGAGAGPESCRIGSVKSNIGHLDTAAGVVGLIKVALALHHREIPASIGYEAPNPAIDFASSPFVVNDRLHPWQADGLRLAGVNSLGVGGTNAHAILQEAPSRGPADESDWPFQPLVLSARNGPALEAQSAALAAHLRAHPDQDLADVAWTLKQGRRAFARRRVLVAACAAEAADLLEGSDPRRVFTHDFIGENPDVVFMFPGGGAQYAGMGRDLYATEPVFADWMDRGLDLLENGAELRALWLPEKGQEAQADQALKRPSLQLPLIMLVEYALAKLYESWGVRPSALIGHSLGENTAAALAGVMDFADCLRLVALRGRLFDRVSGGGMLSVQLSPEDITPLLGAELDLAAVNAPGLVVVSGPEAAIDALQANLAARDIEAQRLAIDIAAHSRMLEPILAEFEAALRDMRLSAPQIPVISNRTGRALTAAEATSPAYWVGHLREQVDYRAGMQHLAANRDRIYLEMGPGRALSSLAQANGVPGAQVVQALRHPAQAVGDDAWHVASLARLWACGVTVDWRQIWGDARRNRVVLPGYPFQRKPYFIAPARADLAGDDIRPERIDDLSGWGWRPHWAPAVNGFDIEDLPDAPPQTWLIFARPGEVSALLRDRLLAAGHRCIRVSAGDTFARNGEEEYFLAPERGREGYDLLIRDLSTRGLLPDRILHGWLVTEDQSFRPGSSFMDRNLEQGFWSLMFLLQAVGDEGFARPLKITVLTNGAVKVRAERLLWPEKAMVLGPVRVGGKELPGVTLSALDLELGRPTRPGPALSRDTLAGRIIEEAMSEGSAIAALRGERRYAQGVRPQQLPELPADIPRGAHVLITGGLGGIGLVLAEDLVRRHGARLTLIARSPLPPRPDWSLWLNRHGPDDPLSRRIRAVERLEALGADLEIAAADVANPQEMEAARDAGIARFGPVHMVIHAAGVLSDGPLMSRSQTQAEAVLTPKLHGTQVLDRLFPDGMLARLVLFSSVSTLTGPAGQVDYVAANEYLNAYAQARAGGATRVTTLDWGIWQGIGMAAEAEAAPRDTPIPISFPMLEESGSDQHGNRIFLARYDIDRWFLDGHRTLAGQALLPGTAYLELAAEAWRAQGETGDFEIADMTVLRALEMADDVQRQIRLRLMRSDEGYGLEVQSEAGAGGIHGWMTHATARLLPLDASQPPAVSPDSIAARLPVPQTGEGLAAPQEALLAFGPRWRVLCSRSHSDTEGLARLDLPEAFANEPAEGWLLHPALLDIATGWAMELIEGYRAENLWVPLNYGRVRVWRALPAHILSHMRSNAPNSIDRPTATFDITLTTPSGEVCVEITGFTIRQLDGPLTFPPPDPGQIEPAIGLPPRLSPGEERLAQSRALGIRPAEGVAAFARALALDLPQVVVSSLDLPALIAQAAAGPGTAGAGALSFERPDLASAYVAPRNEIERRLVGFWEELLGVSNVGVDDSFFDLGGHSLIAVRLFARVRKAFRVDFPISVLFEAPTIAACARLIAEAAGPLPEDENAGTAPSAATGPRRRFTHLVPMHQGAGGNGRPFFLVAGMFGNVLNLRRLAAHLGGDRPFYGMQARGLYGEDRPHGDFIEAARGYIAEMRQVQPNGPYLLGGFSGGGLVAWEIARQLEEAGETVSLLALLDTPLPMRPRLSRKDKALIKLDEFRKKGPAYLLEWLVNRWRWQHSRGQGAAPPVQGGFQNATIESAFRSALALYRMEPRAGRTVLFRPPLDRRWKVSAGNWVSAAREYVFPDNGLTPFSPMLQVIEVPGDHDSMVLEPNVRVLAARLGSLLQDVDKSSGRVTPAHARPRVVG